MKPIATVDRTRDLLIQSQIHPKRLFGQNFLIDPKVAQTITNALSESSHHQVIEIGPGFGALTEHLLPEFKQVDVIEIDHQLARLLPQTLANPAPLKVYEADALKLDWNSLLHPPTAIISNLPYYITSDLLERILFHSIQPELIVVMMQKEVGYKFLKQELHNSNVLTLFSSFFYEIHDVIHVSKNAFFPRPEVDSIVLSFKPIAEKRSVDARALYNFVAFFYQQRRQTLQRRLKERGIGEPSLSTIFTKLSLSPSLRADELTMEQWIDLFNYLH